MDFVFGKCLCLVAETMLIFFFFLDETCQESGQVSNANEFLVLLFFSLLLVCFGVDRICFYFSIVMVFFLSSRLVSLKWHFLYREINHCACAMMNWCGCDFCINFWSNIDFDKFNQSQALFLYFLPIWGGVKVLENIHNSCMIVTIQIFFLLQSAFVVLWIKKTKKKKTPKQVARQQWHFNPVAFFIQYASWHKMCTCAWMYARTIIFVNASFSTHVLESPNCRKINSNLCENHSMCYQWNSKSNIKKQNKWHTHKTDTSDVLFLIYFPDNANKYKLFFLSFSIDLNINIHMWFVLLLLFYFIIRYSPSRSKIKINSAFRRHIHLTWTYTTDPPHHLLFSVNEK